MKSKYISFLIIVLLLGMVCMAAVCAKDSMKTGQFGDVSMDVPKDSNFAKQAVNNSANDMGIEFDMYADEKLPIIVALTDFRLLSNENSVIFYQTMFEFIDPESHSAYEYQDGNLRIMESTSDAKSHYALVGFNLDNYTIILIGEDVNLLKRMAKTAELNS